MGGYIVTSQKPPLSFPSVSGAICTFNSQYAGLPLKAHEVAVNAVQTGAGTPSPSNPRPIIIPSSIHVQNTCGINQWDEQWRTGYYSGTTGQYTPQNNTICSLGRFRCTPSTSYYIYSGSLNVNVFFYDENDNFLSYYYHGNGKVVTTPNDCYWLRWTADYGSGNTYINDISINYPSTDTTYHAFAGQSAAVQIGSTVYGGTYNAITGVLTVTHQLVDLGSLDWVVVTDEGIARTGSVSYMKYLGNMLCTQYNPVKSNDLNDLDIAVTNSQALPLLRVRNVSDFTGKTTAQVKTLLSGIMLLYELATPTLIQLSPARVETYSKNYVFADTGDTTLQYIKLG